jgi:hypothetical protein
LARSIGGSRLGRGLGLSIFTKKKWEEGAALCQAGGLTPVRQIGWRLYRLGKYDAARLI